MIAEYLGPSASVDATAQGEQVRSVAVGRIGPLQGLVPEATLAAIDDALRLHLAL